jgi:hypothetical protein
MCSESQTSLTALNRPECDKSATGASLGMAHRADSLVAPGRIELPTQGLGILLTFPSQSASFHMPRKGSGLILNRSCRFQLVQGYQCNKNVTRFPRPATPFCPPKTGKWSQRTLHTTGPVAHQASSHPSPCVYGRLACLCHKTYRCHSSLGDFTL